MWVSNDFACYQNRNVNIEQTCRNTRFLKNFIQNQTTGNRTCSIGDHLIRNIISVLDHFFTWCEKESLCSYNTIQSNAFSRSSA